MSYCTTPCKSWGLRIRRFSPYWHDVRRRRLLNSEQVELCGYINRDQSKHSEKTSFSHQHHFKISKAIAHRFSLISKFFFFFVRESNSRGRPRGEVNSLRSSGFGGDLETTILLLYHWKYSQDCLQAASGEFGLIIPECSRNCRYSRTVLIKWFGPPLKLIKPMRKEFDYIWKLEARRPIITLSDRRFF